MAENPHEGSSFDDFLREEGIYEECTAKALKRVLAWQIEQEMKSKHISKTAMADLMHTSRSQLDRLLDPENTGVSLDTLYRAAAAIGRNLNMELH
jgi:predicted XRE-type DNA-binding protein